MGFSKDLDYFLFGIQCTGLVTPTTPQWPVLSDIFFHFFFQCHVHEKNVFIK